MSAIIKPLLKGLTLFALGVLSLVLLIVFTILKLIVLSIVNPLVWAETALTRTNRTMTKYL